MRIKKTGNSKIETTSFFTKKNSIKCLAATLCLSFTPGLALGSGLKVQFSLAQGFDDNVYRVNEGTLARKSSFVTELQPSVEWTGSSGLSLKYNPQITRFHSESTEDVIRHNFGFQNSGELESGVQWRLSSKSIRVQGPSEAVIFEQGRNAFSTGAVRERRSQWQNRSYAVVHIPVGNIEIIPDANLLYYDLDTVRKPGVAGYDNYVNRYDLRAGLRLEKPIHAEHRVGFGAYTGYQHHGRQGDRATSRSNHYQRLLISWRGNASEQLSFNLSAGPSFHSYNDGPGPLNITQWYVDASATYRLDAKNQIGFRWNQFNWVASTGNLSNHLKTYSINYSHSMNADWSLRLEALARGLNYHGTPVKDWVYSTIVQVDYQASESLRLSFNIEHNQGCDEAQSRPGREFHRTWVNAKGSWTW